MEEVPCSENAANIAPAAIGMSELSCEPESDVIDKVTLQQQYKWMLSNMNHILDCHIKLEHSKDIEQCAKGFASCNRKDGKDSKVIHAKGRREASVGHLDTNSETISALQELPFSSNINSIEECFNGKDEIQHSEEHVDARFVDNPLMKASDHVLPGSHLASGPFLPSPNCLNILLLDACRSDVSQDSGTVFLSQASASEVRLPLISREPGHVNGESQSESPVTFAVQLKSEPVEENMVINICRSKFAVPYCTDTSCCPVTEVDAYSSLPSPCPPEGTSVDDSSSERCKSQHIHEGVCRYSEESFLDSVQGLLHESDDNHPKDTIPSLLPLEVKIEPLEEINVKCTPEMNDGELSIPPTSNLNSNRKLPDSVLSSFSIRPKLESVDRGQLVPSESPPSILPEIAIQRPIVKVECIDECTTDFLDHI